MNMIRSILYDLAVSGPSLPIRNEHVLYMPDNPQVSVGDVVEVVVKCSRFGQTSDKFVLVDVNTNSDGSRLTWERWRD